jgi:O-methyltransferase
MKQYALQRLAKTLRWLAVGTPPQRRRVRHECARIAASIFGDYPVSDDYKLWREDKEFLQRFSELSPHNPYSADRKFTLREFVRFTQSISGAIAECGSHTGVSAYYLAESAPETTVFLFDSFEGLSTQDDVDHAASPNVMPWQRGDLSAKESILRQNLNKFKNISIKAGWIPQRFYEVAEQSFRLVHIDVDLYRPTLDSMQFFYPRVNPGGVIVLDDYGSLRCPGAHRAIQEYMSNKPEYVMHLTTGQGIVIRQAQSMS